MTDKLTAGARLAQACDVAIRAIRAGSDPDFAIEHIDESRTDYDAAPEHDCGADFEAWKKVWSEVVDAGPELMHLKADLSVLREENERLRARLERVEGALLSFASDWDGDTPCFCDPDWEPNGDEPEHTDDCIKALAALSGEKEGQP